jgi:HD-GYP domain-containing protein (c-di-GMP phosphodiesterase class II)
MVINDLKDPKDDTIMLINVNSPQNEKVVGHFLQNAINVCVYATKIGISEGLQAKDLMALSLGALLHDIGNIRVSQEILQKPASLTRGEYDLVKQHCEYGFDMLKNEPGIPMTAALCALMHHERINGSGYPNGLKGSEIHPYARWIGLIDAYDAMTNPRPYRKALLPHEAMEILFANAGTLFDLEKVELFRNKVAIFPIGLSVSLSTGEQGIVAKVNANCLQRPVVRVLNDCTGSPIKQPYDIDLSKKLHVMISRIGDNIAV